MKKFLCFLLGILFIVPLNAQIIEQNTVPYRGAPGEPIIISNPTKGQILQNCNNKVFGRDDSGNLVSLYDLEQISKIYPKLRNYKFLTSVKSEATSHGNVFYTITVASWKNGGSFSDGYWSENTFQAGAFNAVNGRSTGLASGSQSDIFQASEPFCILTKN